MKSIDLSAVDLNLLVAFEALVDTESVTAASQRIHIGQPAMSAALSRLRILFEDELFVRVGRQMRPTTRALELAPIIRQALNYIRQALADPAFDQATTERTFRVGCSDYLVICLAPKFVDYSNHARLTWDLVNFDKEHVPSLLEKNVIDLALGTFQDLPSGISQKSLIEERLVGICRPGHPALSPNLSVVDYAAMSHALFTLRRDRSGAVDQALAELKLSRKVVLTTSYFLVLPMVIGSTDLVAAIPYHLADSFQRKGIIEVFELPMPIEPWTISMIWSRVVDQDPAHRWLRSIVSSHFEGLHAQAKTGILSQE